MEEQRGPTEEQRARIKAIADSAKLRDARQTAWRFWASMLGLGLCTAYFAYNYLYLEKPPRIAEAVPAVRAVDPFVAVCDAMRFAEATSCHANKEALRIEVTLPMNRANAQTSCIGAAAMIREKFPIISSAWELQISSAGSDPMVLARCQLP